MKIKNLSFMGYPDYSVTSEGAVIRDNYRGTGRPRELKLCYDSYGYPVVNLYENKKMKTYKVHRLVAEAFISKIEGLDLVEHINENPKDNRVENLKWSNHSMNMITKFNGINGDFFRKEMSTRSKKYFSKKENRIKQSKSKGFKGKVLYHPKYGERFCEAINEFCREWDLTPTNLSKIIIENNGTHKGWKVSL